MNKDDFVMIATVLGFIADLIGISQFTKEKYSLLVGKIQDWRGRSNEESSNHVKNHATSATASTDQTGSGKNSSNEFQEQLDAIMSDLKQSDQDLLKTELVRWIGPVMKKYANVPEIEYPYGEFIQELLRRLTVLRITHKIFNTSKLVMRGDKNRVGAPWVHLPTFTQKFPYETTRESGISFHGFYWELTRKRNIQTNWEIIWSNIRKHNTSVLVLRASYGFPFSRGIEDVTDKERNGLRYAPRGHVVNYAVNFRGCLVIFNSMEGRYVLELDFPLFAIAISSLVLDFLKTGRAALENKHPNDKLADEIFIR